MGRGVWRVCAPAVVVGSSDVTWGSCARCGLLGCSRTGPPRGGARAGSAPRRTHGHTALGGTGVGLGARRARRLRPGRRGIRSPERRRACAAACAPLPAARRRPRAHTRHTEHAVNRVNRAHALTHGNNNADHNNETHQSSHASHHITRQQARVAGRRAHPSPSVEEFLVNSSSRCRWGRRCCTCTARSPPGTARPRAPRPPPPWVRDSSQPAPERPSFPCPLLGGAVGESRHIIPAQLLVVRGVRSGRLRRTRHAEVGPGAAVHSVQAGFQVILELAHGIEDHMPVALRRCRLRPTVDVETVEGDLFDCPQPLQEAHFTEVPLSHGAGHGLVDLSGYCERTQYPSGGRS